MGKLNKKILRESDELDWIHSAGQNKILTINKLKELFKQNNIDVDWDIEYDRTEDGHGEYNEYFGKFYYDRENPISYNESYFIELYEKKNGHLFFQLYRYDEEDDKYYRDEVYSQIETSSKNPEKFWRTVGWLVLYQMGKIKPGYGEETFDVENTINESDDFDWVSGFTWYKEMLDSMLSDCKPLRVANFNIGKNQPYMSAGGPSIMFLSRCKEWWDYFSTVPSYPSAFGSRGPAEWFTEDNYDVGEYGVIWNPGWSRKKITPQLEDLKHGYTSAITTGWGYGIEKQLNGTGVSEAWFVVDENNRPVYNLIPNNVKGYAKIYEEEFFGDKLNESKEDEFDWAREIPGTKEYGQKYRYFEIIACYGVDYETEECDDEYSHHIRIPSDEVDEIWDIPDGDFDYLAGPGDEAEGVIMYAIKNRLIPPGDLNEIVMFQGVREEDDSHFDGIDEPQIFESNELDWIKDIEVKGFEKNKSYVVDIRHVKPYTPMSVSPTSEEYTKLTRADVLNKLKWVGYNIDEIPINDADYLYIEPNDKAGYWDGAVWIGQTHWVDYDMGHNTPDPTYDGKYEIMDIDNLMFLLDNNLISESTDFDWVEDIPLTMNTCEAYNILNPGDEIIIDAIDNWGDNPNQWDDNDEIQTFYNVKAKVLALDECNNIHRGNESDARTILVSIEEDGYYGFDDLWADDFVGTLPKQCQKDNCMFLICDKNEEEYVITLSEPQLSESDELNWFKSTGLGKVDLRDCKPGDILITRSGKTVEYVGPTEKGNYYDHIVKYNDGHSYGSRTHDGYVFRKNRRDDDEDIIHVLKEYKKTITEAAGISFEARKWGEIIYNEIMNSPDEKKRLIIDGYDHPEAFNGFPIDYVVIDFYDKLTGYGQEHSGYDKDGNYVVLLYVQPKLLQGQGGYNLKSVLNHEMKHAWEDYNRLSKGLPSIEHTKESQELYNRDFILMLSDQNITGPIKEILKYYYYLSDLEKSAYLENVYDQNKVYERVLRDIAGKDFNEFKDRFDLDINWHLMNTAYDIPFLKKFKSPIDFIDYSAEELRSKALKMIKKVNKMRYIHKK
jgi:hypothetical protein